MVTKKQWISTKGREGFCISIPVPIPHDLIFYVMTARESLQVSTHWETRTEVLCLTTPPVPISCSCMFDIWEKHKGRNSPLSGCRPTQVWFPLCNAQLTKRRICISSPCSVRGNCYGMVRYCSVVQQWCCTLLGRYFPPPHNPTLLLIHCKTTSYFDTDIFVAVELGI